MIENNNIIKKPGRNEQIYNIMKSGRWYSLADLNKKTGYSTASISAGIRDFRKPKYGSNVVLKKKVKSTGVYEYSLKNIHNILKEMYK